MRARATFPRRIFLLTFLGAVLACTMVTGWLTFATDATTTPSSAASPTQILHSYRADRSITLTVYGDSISQGDSRGFAYLDLGKRSWVSHLDARRVRFAGGQAVGGTRSGDLEDRFQEGARSRVLVLCLGTNDFRTRAATVDRMMANFDAFYAKHKGNMGSPQVVTVALGPMDDRDAEQIREWNRQLEAQSSARGWTYADPWGRIRDSANHWLPRYRHDDVHPNESGAAILAEELSKSVEQAAD